MGNIQPEFPVVIINGREVYYNAAEALMDDGLRERLHGEIAPCTEQQFADAYAEAHASAFGEIWDIN